MKSSRFKKEYRRNASKLHKKVGDFLYSFFPHHKIYQEYHVKYINPSWPDYRAKFDYVVKDLKIVIECHGKQHREEVQWSGRIVSDPLVPHKSLHDIQEQDRKKQQAAEEAGYLYIVVWYDEDPQEVISKAMSREWPKPVAMEKPKKKRLVSRPVDKNSEYYKIQKERAREYRKKRYQEYKKWRQSILQAKEAK